MIGDIKKAKLEAAAKGEKQFFANIPCRPYGHNGNRFTSSGGCVECDRIRYKENAAARIETMRKWREANPEIVKAACKRWKDKNPEAVRTHRYNRRRNKERGPGFTSAQADAVFEAQGKKCANCLKPLTKYHADHIVPLAKGGLHDILNIQALCAPCNHKKHKKDPIKWANENGRLI